MKVTAIELARAVWLIPARELNPYGLSTVPIVMALIDRYKFADIPNIVEATKANKGYEFKQGIFDDPKRGQLVTELAFHSDGIVADTRADTDASVALLEDLFSWLKSKWGLDKPQHVQKIYFSSMYVETEKSLHFLNPKLTDFSKHITEKAAKPYPLKYELASLGFWSEQHGATPPPQFKFERAVGLPYTDNNYFSSAPTTTAEHIALLEELENLLG